MTRPYRRPLPPALAPAERMARKQQQKEQRQAKQQERKAAIEKYGGLSFEYAQIEQQHRETVQDAALDIRRRLKRTVEDMIEIGRRLIEVKALLPHGQFLAWMHVEFEQNVRDLQKSMHVAHMIASTPKAGNYPLLSANALYLLAAPSTPDTVRWGIQERIELVDWRPTRRDIQKLINVERPPKSVKKLTGPVAEPDGDVISAEYTVQPRHEFIVPGKGLTPDKIAPVIGRELGRKLQDALVHRIFKELLTRDEYDELMIALTRALEE